MTTVLFLGGGSGGHIYPNINIINYYRSQINSKTSDKWSIYYGVAHNSKEEQLVHKNNINELTVPQLGGMPRNLLLILWLFKLLIISWHCYIHLRKIKPHIIFATGGYASAPWLLSACILRIPYIIHNLDSCLGLSNQVFGKYATAWTLGMPLIKEPKFLSQSKKSAILTGNPVDYKLHTISSTPKSQDKHLLITGGSQGSYTLNKHLLETLSKILNTGWTVTHQFGSYSYAELQTSINNLQTQYPDTYKPLEYIDNIAEAYKTTSIAIVRAGAMTLTELDICKIPAIVIPLAKLAQNHQVYNAQIYAQHSPHIQVLEQTSLEANPLELLNILNTLHTNTTNNSNTNQNQATVFNSKNPSEIIINLINNIAHE